MLTPNIDPILLLFLYFRLLHSAGRNVLVEQFELSNLNNVKNKQTNKKKTRI